MLNNKYVYLIWKQEWVNNSSLVTSFQVTLDENIAKEYCDKMNEKERKLCHTEFCNNYWYNKEPIMESISFENNYM